MFRGRVILIKEAFKSTSFVDVYGMWLSGRLYLYIFQTLNFCQSLSLMACLNEKISPRYFKVKHFRNTHKHVTFIEVSFHVSPRKTRKQFFIDTTSSALLQISTN